jgi:hypothetical protein
LQEKKTSQILLNTYLLSDYLNRYTMVQTSTLMKFHLWKNPAKLLLLLLLTCMAGFTQAQGGTTIFRETVGQGPIKSITLYQAEKRFDHNKNNADPQLTYSGTGSVSNIVNSDYAGASGKNNIYLLPGQTFIINGVNTLEYKDLSLSFGAYRTDGNRSLRVEVSTDNGASWVNLFVGGFSSNAVWLPFVVNREANDEDSTLPQAGNVMFRFTNPSNSGTQMRIDDFQLSGVFLDKKLPVINSFSPQEGGVGTLVTVTGTDLTSINRITFVATYGSTRIISSEDTKVVFEILEGALEGAEESQLAIYSPLLGEEPFITDDVFKFIKPTITSFRNDKGETITHTVSGSTIRLVGKYLRTTQEVIFEDGISVVPTIISDEELEVIVPEGAVTGVIEVMTKDYWRGFSTEELYISRIIFLGIDDLKEFTTMVGAPSETQSYMVAGYDLSEDISISAPLNFEISATGLDGSWISITGGTIVLGRGPDGEVDPTPIFIRYNPSSVGSHTGDIAHTSDIVLELVRVTGISTSTIPLPVELISFNAVKQSSAVLLTWATASEQDNDFFDIEMTENMKGEFKAVGRVHSKVNTSSIKQNYQFSHKGNFTGTRYYRLKQVDLDGTFEYSKVVAVSANGMHMAVEPRVYPNPITPDSKLVYTADAAGKLNVTVVNMSGTRIQSKSYDVEAGENTIVLNLSDNLPAGIYILMTEFNGKTQQVKLIKQ